jgi:D-tyrosyl-tRNA(Tyr) deacylase
LVGIHENDTQKDLEYCCKKLLGCKLWPNPTGTDWRHGVKQRDLEILCVSQFTLYGKLTKKHQPDYKASMKAIPAKAMYENFIDLLKSNYEADKIKDGVFGAMMDVGTCLLYNTVMCAIMYVLCSYQFCMITIYSVLYKSNSFYVAYIVIVS